jgi:ferredoxin
VNYRVAVDKEICIGSGKCVGHAPAAFGFDENDTSSPLESINTVADATILEAAKLCPVSAISVFDSDGRELFPAE